MCVKIFSGAISDAIFSLLLAKCTYIEEGKNMLREDKADILMIATARLIEIVNISSQGIKLVSSHLWYTPF